MTETLGDRLKILREEKGLSQREIAKELRISQTLYCYIEKGKQFPSIRKLVRLSCYFKVTTDYLLCLTDKRRSFDD